MLVFLLSRFRRPAAGIAICLSSLATPVLAASGSVDFANVAVGATRTRQNVAVRFSQPGRIESIKAVLGGVTGLDYARTNGSCSRGSVYRAGQSCTVSVSFTPQFPGTRNGAIVIADASGATLATTYLTGIGQGALATFPAATPKLFTDAVAPSGLSIDTGMAFYAIDGRGRIYVPDLSQGPDILVVEPDGSRKLFARVPSQYGNPVPETFDGAGNLVLQSGSTDSQVIRIDPSGKTSLVAVIKPQPPYNRPIGLGGIVALGNGDLLVGTSNRPGEPGYLFLVHPDGTYKVLPGPEDPYAQTSVSALAVSSSGTVYGVSYGWVYQNNGLLFKNAYVFGVAVDASGTLLTGSQSGYLGLPQPCPTPSIPGGCSAVPAPPVNQLPFLFPTLDARGDVYASFFNNVPDGGIYKILRTQAPAVSFASPGTATSYGSFAITNSGNQPLDLSNLNPTLAGPNPKAFDIEKNNCGQSLAPAATCTIALSFTPGGTFPKLPTAASLLLNGLTNTTTVVPLQGIPNQ